MNTIREEHISVKKKIEQMLRELMFSSNVTWMYDTNKRKYVGNMERDIGLMKDRLYKVTFEHNFSPNLGHVLVEVFYVTFDIERYVIKQNTPFLSFVLNLSSEESKKFDDILDDADDQNIKNFHNNLKIFMEKS